VRGKQCYIAPEELRGGDPVQASDVFALGVTLHTLAAGRAPLETWVAIAQWLGGAPLVLEPSLDPRVARLVGACMALSPEARPSAGDVARALAALGPPGPSELARWIAAIAPGLVGSHDELFDPSGL
jgi:serine/threonine protein kinase